MAKHAATEREPLEQEAVSVTVAGRIMLKRVMGKASFATIQDTSGRIQIYVSEGDTGKDAQDAFKHNDIGDIIGVTGTLFKTKTDELTIRCKYLFLFTYLPQGQ
jgi:lysyl-tRNA synthetase class 2